jgi:WD40 repeat protein
VLDLPGAHRAAVTAVTVGPRGWFVTGSRDRTVKVWDPTGRPVLTLPQTRPVRRVFWSEDGNALTILAEGERGLRRWDLAALKAELGAIGLDPALP